ncbi:MAG: hypothetical protein R2712_10305 [Vicinamibacterales bacterium]
MSDGNWASWAAAPGAPHVAQQTDAEIAAFFEDDMLLQDAPGLCRNGFPTRVPGLLASAVEILQNETTPRRLPQALLHGVLRRPPGPEALLKSRSGAAPRLRFPDGPGTRIAATSQPRGRVLRAGRSALLQLATSSSPRAGNERLFLEDEGATRFEQTLMVRRWACPRRAADRRRLLASPINHDRQVHYPGGRKSP